MCVLNKHIFRHSFSYECSRLTPEKCVYTVLYTVEFSIYLYTSDKIIELRMCHNDLLVHILLYLLCKLQMLRTHCYHFVLCGVTGVVV